VNLLDSLATGLDEARRHWGQTVLSLLGLVLGTASIVTVLALFGGQAALTQQYLDEVGGVGTVIVRNREAPLAPSARELASRRISYRDAELLDARAPSVLALSPGWSRELEYAARGVAFDGEVVGAVPDYARINDLSLLAGRFLGDLDVERRSRVTVLGWAYADSLFGDAAAALGSVVRLGGVPYTVAGVLTREEFYFAPWEGNSLEYRNRRAYVPITTALGQYSPDSDGLDFLTAKAAPSAGTAAAEAQIRNLLYHAHGAEDFDITPAGAGGDSDSGEFLMLFNFIFLVVGVVSMFAGGVVIANILLASVVERVREFGTRMALGATGFGIFAQVLAEVLVVTVLGGLAGLAIGAGLTGVVAYFMKIPAVVTPLIAGIAIGTSLGVGVLAGLYPAVRAARLSPVEALRYG
jgi:ABC-type antimicrobial peptide transport system permease subunit